MVHAQFRQQLESLPCEVCEISRGGAKLQAARLLAGNQHIVVDNPDRLQLEIMHPTGILTLPFFCRWYDYAADAGLFVLGLEFADPSLEDKSLLDQILRDLPRG